MSALQNEEYKRCQSIFWSLARWTETDVKHDPRSYLYQYMETAQCDQFSDLAYERENSRNFFTKRGFVDGKGKTPVDKIMKFDDLTSKENLCLEAAVDYYRYWNQKAVLNSLGWSHYLYYQTWEKYERFVSAITGAGGYTLVRRFSRRQRNRENARKDL